jgi:hypothetical protein
MAVVTSLEPRIIDGATFEFLINSVGPTSEKFEDKFLSLVSIPQVRDSVHVWSSRPEN